MIVELPVSTLGWLRTAGVHLVRSRVSLGSAFESPCDFDGHIAHGVVHLGAFSFCQGGRFGNVKIGRYCSIAADVAIGLDEHPTDWLSTSPMQYSSRTRSRWASFRSSTREPSPALARAAPKTTCLGHDVWVGYRAIIRAGVQIGDGAIVAGGAVVVKDVPPYAIVGGNPAKFIRWRFDEQTVQELQRLAWWRYSLLDIDHGYDRFSIDALENDLKGTPLYAPEPIYITHSLIGGTG